MIDAPIVRIAGLSRRHVVPLLASALLGALAILAGTGLLATSGYVISRAALKPPILMLWVAIVGVRFFGVSRAVLRYLERLSSHDAVLRAIGAVRVGLFERLEPLVPGGLPGARTGDLLTRFVTDVDELQNLWLRGIAPMLVALLAGVCSAGVAALIDPAAGAALAVALLLAGAAVPLLAVALTRASGRREAPARARLGAELMSAVEAAPELVAFGGSAAAAAEVERCDRAFGRARRRTALVSAAAEGGVTALAGLAVVAMLAIAAASIHSGLLGGVWLATLALLAMGAFEAVRPLPAAASHLAGTAQAARRVLELTDRKPAVSDPADPESVGDGAALHLQGVRVRFDGGPWVLDGVDLDLAPGRIVALTGESGSGKTTLAQLLVRFREPDEGSVSLNGHDLRRLAQADVRRRVGLAGQDAHLFPTSIRENLRIARPDADDAELEDALRRAHVWDWVSGLPEGLSTEVGEDGSRVSGGQRQRIALARALLADVGLLVLDEPAAHLDRDTADEVIGDLLRTARTEGLGVLLISHEPAGLDLADEVYELRGGRLVAVR
jgi:thiol reductant ABC exporter CydC subunit